MRIGTPGTKGRQARSAMLNAINAQLRAESGAAVPEEEVDRAFERFVPSPLDDDATKQQKLDSLNSLLTGTLELVKGPPQTEEQIPTGESIFQQQPATGERQIATNPQTGQKLILRGGQWQPL